MSALLTIDNNKTKNFVELQWSLLVTFDAQQMLGWTRTKDAKFCCLFVSPSLKCSHSNKNKQKIGFIICHFSIFRALWKSGNSREFWPKKCEKYCFFAYFYVLLDLNKKAFRVMKFLVYWQFPKKHQNIQKISLESG